MTTHELAELLYKYPNLPVMTHANNHTCRDNVKVAEVHFGINSVKYICIGNMNTHLFNTSNETIVQWLEK